MVESRERSEEGWSMGGDWVLVNNPPPASSSNITTTRSMSTTTIQHHGHGFPHNLLLHCAFQLNQWSYLLHLLLHTIASTFPSDAAEVKRRLRLGVDAGNGGPGNSDRAPRCFTLHLLHIRNHQKAPPSSPTGSALTPAAAVCGSDGDDGKQDDEDVKKRSRYCVRKCAPIERAQ